MKIARAHAVLLAAAAVVACGTTPPSPAPAAATETPVTWSVAAAGPGGPAAPGGTSTFSAIVTAKIARGWHIYAMSQPPGGPVPLAISLKTDSPFAAAGDIVEPTPKTTFDANFNLETRFFEDEAAFTVPVRAAATGAGSPDALALDVRYQACADTRCMPAKTTTLTLNVKSGSH